MTVRCDLKKQHVRYRITRKAKNAAYNRAAFELNGRRRVTVTEPTTEIYQRERYKEHTGVSTFFPNDKFTLACNGTISRNSEATRPLRGNETLRTERRARWMGAQAKGQKATKVKII